MTERTFYEILGLYVTATMDQIKWSYRHLSRLLHPDRNRNPAAKEQFQELQRAYATLSDPVRRERYDNDQREHQERAHYDQSWKPPEPWEFMPECRSEVEEKWEDMCNWMEDLLVECWAVPESNDRGGTLLRHVTETRKRMNFIETGLLIQWSSALRKLQNGRANCVPAEVEEKLVFAVHYYFKYLRYVMRRIDDNLDRQLRMVQGAEKGEWRAPPKLHIRIECTTENLKKYHVKKQKENEEWEKEKKEREEEEARRRKEEYEKMTDEEKKEHDQKRAANEAKEKEEERMRKEKEKREEKWMEDLEKAKYPAWATYRKIFELGPHMFKENTDCPPTKPKLTKTAELEAADFEIGDIDFHLVVEGVQMDVDPDTGLLLIQNERLVRRLYREPTLEILVNDDGMFANGQPFDDWLREMQTERPVPQEILDAMQGLAIAA